MCSNWKINRIFAQTYARTYVRVMCVCTPLLNSLLIQKELRILSESWFDFIHINAQIGPKIRNSTKVVQLVYVSEWSHFYRRKHANEPFQPLSCPGYAWKTKTRNEFQLILHLFGSVGWLAWLGLDWLGWSFARLLSFYRSFILT